MTTTLSQVSKGDSVWEYFLWRSIYFLYNIFNQRLDWEEYWGLLSEETYDVDGYMFKNWLAELKMLQHISSEQIWKIVV